MTTCSAEGCGHSLLEARGLCKTHYNRWAKEHPDQLRPKLPSGVMRDWVLANYDADPTGPCVLWPFGVDEDGYGRKVWIDGRAIFPHAYATMLRDGPAPVGRGLAIHGPCHNRLCILHVHWGTPAENSADMVRDGTSLRGERNHRAKLRADDVREIRRRVAEGETQMSVASAFGVHYSTVSLIVLRRKWGWLT